ncbi:MAG: tetratricopeptide repeat protein [Chloroflexales bacterium]|nr:tetratricopeptide repeat protein [Chloroflexales bacterium]
MLHLAEDLEEMLAGALDERQKIDVLNQLAWAIKDRDPRRGLVLSQTAYSLSRTGSFVGEPYHQGLGKSLTGLTVLNKRLSNYDAALSTAFEAIPILECIEDIDSLLVVLNAIGTTYRTMADYPGALTYHFRALQLARKIDNKSQEASTLNNIGLIYNKSGDYLQELAVYQQSLRIYQEVGHIHGEASVYNNIAMAYLSSGNHHSALLAAQQSLELAQAIGHKTLEANVFCTLGEISTRMEDYQQALNYLQQGVDTARAVGLRFVEMYSLLNIGRLYNQQQQSSVALPFLLQALAIAEETASKAELAQCHQILAEAYKQQHDFAASLYHFEQFHSIEKEIFNDHSDQRLKNLQIIHNTETAVQEAELYQLKNAALEQEVAEREKVTAALGESERRYRTIYNTTPVMFHSVDAEGYIVDVNDYWLKTMAYECREEVIGRKTIEFLTEESRQFALEVGFPTFFREGLGRNGLHQFVKKNGDVIQVLLSATAERDNNGSVARSLTAMVDVTDRYLAEKSLKTSQANLSALIDSTTDLIWSVDRNYALITVNAALKRLYRSLFGSEVELAPGVNIVAVSPPDLANEFRNHYNHVFKGERFTTELTSKNIILEMTFTPIVTETGVITGAAVFARDITQRKQSEIDLQQANEALRRRVAELAALNRITQAVVTLSDLHSILEAIAQQMTQLFSARSTLILLLNAEKTNLTVAVDNDIDPNASDTTAIKLDIDQMPIAAQILATQQPLIISQKQIDDLPTPFREVLQAKDGCCGMLVPLHMRGDLIGIITVVTDQPERAYTIAELKLAETIAGQLAGAIEHAKLLDETQKARELAEAANRAKSQFLSTMSHELRTPLTSVLGYVQILKRDPSLSEGQLSGLNIIEQSGDHLLMLLNDILDLAKIEAGKLELRESEICLATFLEGINEIVCIRAQKQNIYFRFEVVPAEAQDRLLTTFVRADEKCLRQVLINLLGNAVKFTHTGGVTFRVGYVDTGADPALASGKRVFRFQIEDTGIGIAPEDLKTIFQPFQQVHNSINRSTGTGLGLTISVNLIDLMGSALQVSSTLNEGSSFWFDLALTEVNNTWPVDTSTGPYTQRILGDDSLACADSRTQIVPPSPEDLADLLDLAIIGDIQTLRQCVDTLEQSNEQLQPFAQEIHQLTQEFQIDKIRDLLKSYSQNGHP